MRSTAGRHGQTQRISLIRGAAKPGCQAPWLCAPSVHIVFTSVSAAMGIARGSNYRAANALFDTQSIVHRTAMLGVRMPFVRIGSPSGQGVGTWAPCRAPPHIAASPQYPKTCSSNTASASAFRTLGSHSVATPHVFFHILCLPCISSTWVRTEVCAFIAGGTAEAPKWGHRHDAGCDAIRRWDDHLRIAAAELTSSRYAPRASGAHGQTLAGVV